MSSNPRSVALLKRVSASAVFRDYEEAFSEATRLPLSLRATAAWDPSSAAASGTAFANPFCAILARHPRACTGSHVVEQPPVAGARPTGTRTVTCFAGLSYSTVPVRLGEEVMGFLHTGQVALQAPTRARFKDVVKQLTARGVAVNLPKLETAYFQSRVVSPEQYRSMLKLLEMFAQHLSLVANQVDVQAVSAESAPVRLAKRFITEHQGEAVTLAQVAGVLHMSTFYFCKIFKRATGRTFTDYLGRQRIETAKTLLLNPHRRVSEVAYDVGFGSLTHFNRLFSRHACQSPTAYRAALPVLARARG